MPWPPLPPSRSALGFRRARRHQPRSSTASALRPQRSLVDPQAPGAWPGCPAKPPLRSRGGVLRPDRRSRATGGALQPTARAAKRSQNSGQRPERSRLPRRPTSPAAIRGAERVRSLRTGFTESLEYPAGSLMRGASSLLGKESYCRSNRLSRASLAWFCSASCQGGSAETPLASRRALRSQATQKSLSATAVSWLHLP